MSSLARVAALVATHSLCIVGSAFVAIQAYGDRHLSGMHEDARYQLGLYLGTEGQAPPGGLAPLPQVLQELEAQYDAGSATVQRLICALLGTEQGGELQLEEAQRACRELQWSDCSAPKLELMRGVLGR